MEKEGVPGVYLVAKGFEQDTRSAAVDHGMSMQRQVILDGYYWYIPPEESKPIAKAHIDDIIDALLRPLTPEEANPKPLKKVEYPPIKITAKSYSAAIEEFHRIFNENHWSDGLALVPPTREAVDLMLTGTSRSPDEVIGNVAVKNGEATIEKIAINAVMAGASPEYLPVIIAAIEAVTGETDEDFDLVHPQASLGGFQLAIYVSGPIAEELNMNSGSRLWTYGNRANSSIGRAIRLSLINLGHMWPGINDMAKSRVYPYTYFTFAEDMAGSPWEPYHVERGFKTEDSCVTVTTIRGVMPADYSGTVAYEEAGEYLQAQATINRIIETIRARRSEVITGYVSLAARPSQHPEKYIFMVTPEMAKDLKGLGFTQENLRNYIYDATSIPYEELTPQEIENVKERIRVSIEEKGLKADQIHPKRLPVFQEALQPGGKVPILLSPEDIHFVVAGGEGKSLAGWSYMRSIYTWSSHETKLIHGATLTKAGR